MYIKIVYIRKQMYSKMIFLFYLNKMHKILKLEI